MIPTAYTRAMAQRFDTDYEPILKAIEPMFEQQYPQGADHMGLKDVSVDSLVLALEELAELNALNSLGQGASLLPKLNHQTRYPEAVPMLNYQFMLTTAIQSGFIEKAEANLVFSNDEFRFKSRNERVFWKPCNGDRGELRCAFVTVASPEGMLLTTLMDVNQLTAALEDARDKLFGGFLPLTDQAEYALGSCVRRAIGQWEPLAYADESRTKAYDKLVNLIHFHHRHFEDFDKAVANAKLMQSVQDKRHVSTTPSPLQALVASAKVKLDGKREAPSQPIHQKPTPTPVVGRDTPAEDEQVNWSSF